MTKKRRKRKIKVGRVIIASIISLVLTTIVIGVIYLAKNGFFSSTKTDMYLASDSTMVEIYTMDEEGNLNLSKELVRGTKVVSLNDEIINEDVGYTEIEFEDSVYYVMTNNIVLNEKEDRKSVV